MTASTSADVSAKNRWGGQWVAGPPSQENFGLSVSSSGMFRQPDETDQKTASLFDDWLESQKLKSRFENSPIFDTSRLPLMDDPYIPVGCSKKKLLTDAQQGVTHKTLALAKSFREITPEMMGDHGLMKGVFGGHTFYVVRCASLKARGTLVESAMVIFKTTQGVFAIDRENLSPENYHPLSPIPFKMMQGMLAEIFSKGQCTRLKFKYTGESGVMGEFTQDRISLWTLQPEEKTPTLLKRICSLKAPYHSSTLTLAYSLMVFRSALAAGSVLGLARILVDENHGRLINMLSLSSGLMAYFLQWMQASIAVDYEAISRYMRQTIPGKEVFRVLSKSPFALKELRNRTNNLDKPDADGNPLLVWSEDMPMQKLLIELGAQPQSLMSPNYPILDAAKKGDLKRLEFYLTEAKVDNFSHQQMKELTLEAPLAALEILLRRVPSFVVDTMVSFPQPTSAFDLIAEELRVSPIETESDLVKTKERIQKWAFIIQHSKNQATIKRAFDYIRAMRWLSMHDAKEVPEMVLKTVHENLEKGWICAQQLRDVWESLFKMVERKLQSSEQR